MNGPQSNESCHFRVKTRGLLLCNSKTKTLQTDVLPGLGGGGGGERNQLHKITTQVISEIGITSTYTLLQSKCNYNWDKSRTHAAKVTLRFLSSLEQICEEIRRGIFFPIDYYI
jgi:hypothetical protein